MIFRKSEKVGKNIIYFRLTIFVTFTI